VVWFFCGGHCFRFGLMVVNCSVICIEVSDDGDEIGDVFFVGLNVHAVSVFV
jgi:hypothetical protein